VPLWLGGAQWAGKTTVARVLTERYRLRLYDYDFQDHRAHGARVPAATLNSVEARLEARFALVLEDLAALPADEPVLAEGWGLRPRLVAPLLDSPRQALFLVPTRRFRDRQLRELPRAGLVKPEWLDRNQALARDLVTSARELGLRVIEVDGRLDAEALIAAAEEHFRPYLPDLRPPLPFGTLDDLGFRLPEHLAIGLGAEAPAAIAAALEGRAPLGFAALAAELTAADIALLTARAAEAAPVRGVIWMGERDPWLPAAAVAGEMLRKEGHDVNDVRVSAIPGRGHRLTPEMVAVLPELLSRWGVPPPPGAARR